MKIVKFTLLVLYPPYGTMALAEQLPPEAMVTLAIHLVFVPVPTGEGLAMITGGGDGGGGRGGGAGGGRGLILGGGSGGGEGTGGGFNTLEIHNTCNRI